VPTARPGTLLDSISPAQQPAYVLKFESCDSHHSLPWWTRYPTVHRVSVVVLRSRPRGASTRV